MQAKIVKVVVNMGVGEIGKDKTWLERASNDLAQITGQKPKITTARISIAEFKLRQGDPSGLVVTLRGKRQEAFLLKLFRVVLPRFRDFQGLKMKGFDQAGNYNLGITEQVVFPEIDSTKVDKVRSLQVTMVIKAESVAAAKKALEDLGAPFEKVVNKNG